METKEMKKKLLITPGITKNKQAKIYNHITLHVQLEIIVI